MRLLVEQWWGDRIYFTSYFLINYVSKYSLRMKIPDWAKAAQVSDEMRREVLRSMRRNCKPDKIVHCKCGRGCKKCYGQPHCGCRYCYRPEKRPRALSLGDLELLYLHHETAQLLPHDEPSVATPVLHHPGTTRAESTTPLVKTCQVLPPVKQTQYYCQQCSLNICNHCL